MSHDIDTDVYTECMNMGDIWNGKLNAEKQIETFVNCNESFNPGPSKNC